MRLYVYTRILIEFKYWLNFRQCSKQYAANLLYDHLNLLGLCIIIKILTKKVSSFMGEQCPKTKASKH